VFSLDVGGNQFDLDTARALGESLSENGSLMFLDISDGKLNTEMIGYICSGLKQNTYCKRVTLDRNKLDAVALGYLSDMILNTGSDERLINLNNCDITNDNFVHFLPCVAGNARSLKELVFKENRVGPSGMEMLFQALKNNTNIKKVDCTQNTFSKRGSDAVIDCLYHNQTIVTFYTYSSDIPRNLETIIQEMVSNNNKGIKNTIPTGYVAPQTVSFPSPMALPNLGTTKPTTLYPIPTMVSSDMSNVLSRLKELEEKEKSLKKQVDELEEKDKSLKKQVNELEEKNKSREKEIVSLKDKVGELDKIVESQGKEIIKLKNEVQEKSHNVFVRDESQQPSLGFGGPTRSYMEFIQ